MVSEQIVNETVKRMLMSNIDEDTIISTLKDIGIDESAAKEIISNVKNSGQSSVQNISDDSSESQSSSDNRMNSMQNELQTQAEKSELHETATHNILNEHGNKLDEMNKKVDDVHKVVSSPVQTDSSFSVRIAEVEKKLDDVSAQTTALLDLMKKILETDRQILTELKSK